MVLFGFTIDQARNYTPKIVDQIASGVEKLIAMGAVDIIVPGVMPFGCFALYLTELKSSNKSDYDDYGCLKPLNELAIHHNSLLQTSLAAVQARHRRSPSSSPSSPSPAAAVRIMYADYYAVVAEMMQAPARLGFRSGIAACCGAGGGEYNWEYVARCGMRGAAACANPSSAVCWDGAHTTEAANRSTLVHKYHQIPKCSNLSNKTISHKQYACDILQIKNQTAMEQSMRCSCILS